MTKDKGKQVAVAYNGSLLGNPTAGPSTNPSASITALWSYIQPALDHIVRSPTNNNLGKAPAIDVEYHMGIHTAVYNYFTSQSESLNTRPHNESEKASGIDLYEKLDKYYSDVARELFLDAPLDDSTLIQYLVPCFNRFSAGAQSVNRLLNYVNRHFVKRAVDEDKGWLRFNDVLDAVEKMIKEGDARDLLSKKLKEKRAEELRKWGYEEGASSEVLAQAECSAEAASAADRVVPLSSLAYRRFRIEILDPLLAVPKVKAKKKAKKTPPGGEKPVPKGRLARAVKELLETNESGEEEKQRLVEGLATTLRMSGIRIDHPLRKRLDKYLSTS
jgi:hypothetical protein